MAEESAVQEESRTAQEDEAAVESTAAATLVEPDLNFVREIQNMGGDTLKRCFQCATCSVVCALSPDEKPYPRKEMIYAQWGLKDRLVNDVDIWLCHYCNDCSAYCPRGARPGDVLRAIRAISFRHFAFPSFMGRIVGEAKYLPVMLAIPIVLLALLLVATGNFHIPAGEEIEFSHFFPHYLVDSIFLTMAALAILSLGFGVWNLLQGMHANSIREGYAEDKPLVPGDYVKSLISVIPPILLHTKFKLCTVNRDRYLSHILVLFGFVGLFVVTSIGFLGLYIIPIEALAPPYTALNPIKWLGLVSGAAVAVGTVLMILNRMKGKTAESTTSYLDGALLVVILLTAVTGFLAWFARLGGLAGFAYTIYFFHLVCVFYIIAFLPYSKLAHLVYRTVAMGYAAYIDRPFGVEVSAAPAAAAEPVAAPAEAEAEEAEEGEEEKKEE
ncbi:MAG: quinone-interacting membrane-bound oxidoreductase complex subunit QmoC [Syntrophobacteria bacterium]